MYLNCTWGRKETHLNTHILWGDWGPRRSNWAPTFLLPDSQWDAIFTNLYCTLGKIMEKTWFYDSGSCPQRPMWIFSLPSNLCKRKRVCRSSMCSTMSEHMDHMEKTNIKRKPQRRKMEKNAEKKWIRRRVRQNSLEMTDMFLSDLDTSTYTHRHTAFGEWQGTGCIFICNENYSPNGSLTYLVGILLVY